MVRRWLLGDRQRHLLRLHLRDAGEQRLVRLRHRLPQQPGKLSGRWTVAVSFAHAYTHADARAVARWSGFWSNETPGAACC